MSIYDNLEKLRLAIEEQKATLITQRNDLSAKSRYAEARRCGAAIDATEAIYQELRRLNLISSCTCSVCRVWFDPYRCSDEPELERNKTLFPDSRPGDAFCDECCRKRLKRRGGQ